MLETFLGLSLGLVATVQALTTAYSNSTTPVCCFVVQDTVTAAYWQPYTTTTTYSVVNLTSYTTLITPYPTTTSTNYKTNVYTTNATFSWSFEVGGNPLYLYPNAAPGPTETYFSLNGTQTVTAGVTVTSPAAFFLYSTVKVITAAAVTNSQGALVCGTYSAPFNSIAAITSYGETSVPYVSYTYTETVVETQYSTLKTASFLTPTATITTTITSAYTGFEETTTGRPLETYTATELGLPTLEFANTNAEAYFQSGNGSTTTGVVLSLTTPFAYLPGYGSTGRSTLVSDCDPTSGVDSVGYGYIPATLLDYLIGNPYYSSQYPQLASCHAGGPAVATPSQCTGVAPEVLSAGGDLTSSTIITVTPTAEQVTQASPTNNPQSTSQTTLPHTTPQTTAHTTPQMTPQTAVATSSLAQSPLSSSGGAFPVIPPVPTQSNNASPSSAAVIASAIASGIGATQISLNSPVTNSASNILITIATTIPINPTSPIPGTTTVISGTSNVIVTTIIPATILTVANTIPLNPASPVSGITTVVSGTTNVIISNPTTIPLRTPTVLTLSSTIALNPASLVAGLTTIISSSTFVIVSYPTTISPVIPIVSTLIGTIPFNPASPVSGVTTVISGTTDVVILKQTTVTPAKGTASGVGTYNGTVPPILVSGARETLGVDVRWIGAAIVFIASLAWDR